MDYAVRSLLKNIDGASYEVGPTTFCVSKVCIDGLFPSFFAGGIYRVLVPLLIGEGLSLNLTSRSIYLEKVNLKSLGWKSCLFLNLF